MRCDELRVVAPDLALDELTGEERAAAIGHLARCESCRALVAELAAVADSVLLLAPEVEPPPGFESRVLARRGATGADRRPRRRRVTAMVAAITAVLAAGVGGYLVRGGDGVTLPVAAILHAADGTAAGSVVLADGPDRMTCVFDDPRFGGAYAVQVELDDGVIADVGRFDAPGSPWSWTVPLDVDPGDVRRVIVLDGGGVVRASADVAS